MKEAGVVLNSAGLPIYWHMPDGRTSGGLPDSRVLWDVFWQYRHDLYGFAHSHPGSGVPGPSFSDVTSFAPIEEALGRRLEWPIITSNAVVVCRWVGPDRLTYAPFVQKVEPDWTDELRRLST